MPTDRGVVDRTTGVQNARRAMALLMLLALGGCPGGAEDPQRPNGTACTAVADCNEGRTCGRLRACVDLRCEDAQSLEIPCPGPR